MAELIIVAICLLLNAVFSSIEMAFITVGKPEMRQRVKRGDTKARRLLSLRENPERALSVMQVGITLVGAVSAAVGGAGAEENLAPLLEKGFGLSEDLAEGLAIGAIVVPLTYMSVVVGELVPKTIALRYPTQVLNFGAAFLHIGNRALGPIVTLLEVSTEAERWPCLSPMQSHPGPVAVTMMSLRFDAARDTWDGIFACACGFRYSAGGDGFPAVSSLRLNRVIAHSPHLHRRVTELAEVGYSAGAIARQLNLHRKTVQQWLNTDNRQKIPRSCRDLSATGRLG